MISASAPGKVVLSGEYAVLDGATAICMAVDRRARVTIVETGNDHHSVEAPGYWDTKGRFTSEAGELCWKQGRDDYAIVEAAWSTLQLEPDAAIHIKLDTRRFRAPGGDKLGLGSSAALTVALIASLIEYAGSSLDVSKAARDVHRVLQGGKGSGVDVACSVAGSLIEYRMQEPSITPLNWPSGLCWAILWSGVASSTEEKIARLARAADYASRDELAAASDKMADAWRGGNSQAVLQEYPAYCDVLYKFSVDHELGIFDAGHDLVARAAARQGLVYKPCGAGGGDIGIVMGAEDDVVEAFADKVVDLGFHKLDTSLDRSGVILD
jgi:phosphomevalonate kinase